MRGEEGPVQEHADSQDRASGHSSRRRSRWLYPARELTLYRKLTTALIHYAFIHPHMGSWSCFLRQGLDLRLLWTRATLRSNARCLPTARIRGWVDITMGRASPSHCLVRFLDDLVRLQISSDKQLQSSQVVSARPAARHAQGLNECTTFCDPQEMMCITLL